MFTSCGGGDCSWLLESFIFLLMSLLFYLNQIVMTSKVQDASHVHYSTEEIDLRRC